MLRGSLGDRGVDVAVVHAMRYGEPSLAGVLRELRERNLSRLLVLPLYPQYAAPTTASAFDAIAAELATWRNLPELRMVRSFHRDPGYIAHWRSRFASSGHQGRGDQMVMSSMACHGARSPAAPVPLRGLATAPTRPTSWHGRDEWIATFQSRFGSARWLEPYTLPTCSISPDAATEDRPHLPGFVPMAGDAREIAIEARRRSEGRRHRLHYIQPQRIAAWIGALADLVQRH